MMADLATAVLSVDPWLVEHGDIILGLRTPVASILTDGAFWFYGDDSGTFIAKRPSWGRVQVIRGADQEMIAASLVVEGEISGPADAASPAPSATSSPGGPRLLPDGSGRGGGTPLPPAAAESDWCDPHGITRGRGLWLVVAP